MQKRLIDEVERITARHVLALISNQYVGPDMEVEIFMLEPLGPSVTPTGQKVADRDTG